MNHEPSAAALHLHASNLQVYSGNAAVSSEMRVFTPDEDPSSPDDVVATVPACDQLGAVMTPNVVCMRPDVSLHAAVDTLLTRNISAAPVVDASGKLLGVVSRTDLLAAMRVAAEDVSHASHRVHDVMTPLVFGLLKTASVAQAAALMATEGVHRLLVVAPGGELIGIVSALDVMRWLAERDGYLAPKHP